MHNIVLPNRYSIRLKNYNYSKPGLYFVTICIQHNLCLFGTIQNGEMLLNGAGDIIKRWYNELENKFPDVLCDEFICMPNHVHFIIHTGAKTTVGADLCACPNDDYITPSNTTEQPVGADLRVCPNQRDITRSKTYRRNISRNISGEHAGSPLRRITNDDDITCSPLRDVVQWFKTMTTNEYIRGVRQSGWTPFPGKLWHRNYFEHVVRNEEDLNRIREYIRNNPAAKDWAGEHAGS